MQFHRVGMVGYVSTLGGRDGNENAFASYYTYTATPIFEQAGHMYTHITFFFFFKYVPPKPLTLNLMETLDLWACYHHNASYRKMKRMKVLEKSLINKFGSVHFLYMIHPKNLQNLQKKKFP
jgi:hypothetical protein